METTSLSENKEIEYASNLINTAIKEFNKNNFSMCENLLNEAQPIFRNTNNGSKIALCLALKGAIDYLKDKNN